MKNLIEALTIMMKYCGNEHYPTHCEHDVLYFPKLDYDAVSDVDKARLKELGFVHNTDSGCGFMSYQYGSC